MIYRSVTELIGSTPTMELCGLEKKLKLESRLLVKAEMHNPIGSSKDRAVLYMLDDALRRGIIKKGSVIVEPTSGNTGIALAAIAAVRGYKAIIVMPDTASRERRAIIEAYGGEVVYSDGTLGMRGAIRIAEKLSSDTGAVMLKQFDNLSGVDAHYYGTGAEIYEDTDGKIDMLIAGVGTGATITGVGRYLKERLPDIAVVAVEPSESAVLSGGGASPHRIEGIGAGFIPPVLDTSVYDEVEAVSTEEAIAAARAVGKTDGLLVGISSGAAIAAAIKRGRLPSMKNKTILAILPDGGEKYLSTELFNG